MFLTRCVRNIFAPALVLAATVIPSAGQDHEFEIVAPADGALLVLDGEIEARLNSTGCDDDFESACSITNQLQRSEYVLTNPQKHGDKYTYKWEIFVPEDFVYNASGGYLRAGRFFDTSGESFFSFILDGSEGYHVSRKACFRPEDFGKWHSIEMRVAWDSTKKQGLNDKTPGELRVLCDSEEILTRSGRPNIGAEEQAWLALKRRA